MTVFVIFAIYIKRMIWCLISSNCHFGFSNNFYLTDGESKHSTGMLGYEMKITRLIIKTGMLIYQSMANLILKIFWVKSLIFKAQKLGKCW